MEQKTAEWHKARAGKITCSNLDIVLNGTDKARQNYIDQIIQGLSDHTKLKTFSSKYTDHGIFYEPIAIKRYMLKTGNKVDQEGFIVSEKFNYFGGSPDGLIKKSNGGIEVKCPYNQQNHIETLMNKQVPKHYLAQVHGIMYVCKLDYMDFISYDPRQPEDISLVIIRVDRNENIIKSIEDRVSDFWNLVLEKIYLT